MTPNSATRRDTRPDRYMSHPSIRPVPIPSMNPGPSRNVQFLMAISDLLTTTSEPASALAACCRNVTTARTLRIPTRMNVHSTRRATT